MGSLLIGMVIFFHFLIAKFKTKYILGLDSNRPREGVSERARSPETLGFQGLRERILTVRDKVSRVEYERERDSRVLAARSEWSRNEVRLRVLITDSKRLCFACSK